MKIYFYKKRGRLKDNNFIIQEGRVEDASLSDGYKKRWVEETWFRDDHQGTSQPLKEFLGVAINKKNIKIVFFVIILFIILIIAKLFYLQIWRGNFYFLQAENNRLRSQPIVAERGIIFDKQMRALTTNISAFDLVLIPHDLPKESTQLDYVLQRIAIISGEDVNDLRKKVDFWKNSSYQAINLVDNLDYQKAIKLLIESADLPGVNLEQAYKRFYKFNHAVSFSTSSIKTNHSVSDKNIPGEISSLSHVVGYLGRLSKEELAQNPNYLLTDYAGKSGLEKSYESVLRGQYGQKQTEVDALGKEKNVVKIIPPQPGKNLVLTIDVDVQKKLEQIVVANLVKQNKKRAAVIVMDSRNGEILAMVNWPSFNNNLFVGRVLEKEYQQILIDSDAPLFSRAWSGAYPSGSIIKQIVAAAALNEGIITRTTSFLSTGGIRVDRWFFPDWKAGGHGLTNVTKALAESVNTFFYIIGGGHQNFVGLGLDKLSLYFEKFGLGKQLGIDLPNEASGFIPTREWKEKTKKQPWYIGDTYNLSIGQGDLLVTPLQMASITATVANGGTIFKPHVVKSIINPMDNSSVDIKKEVLATNVIPDNYLQIVRDGMRQAVTEGSAKALFNLPVKVAGKTGTAQWSSKAPNHAWFTSFAPYDNPQIVVTVLVEEGVEGSASAIPIAHDFYNWWFSTEHNHP